MTGLKNSMALNPSRSPQDHAVKRLPDAKISGHFYEDDLFKDNFFDLVSLIHVVDHLVRPERTLSARMETAKARRNLYRCRPQHRIAARQTSGRKVSGVQFLSPLLLHKANSLEAVQRLWF